MNIIKNLFTWALLMAATHVMAVDVTVDAVEITAGGSTEIVVNLANTETTLTGYQMTLYLPEGVSLATDSEGDYEYTLSSRHKKDHTMTIRSLSDGGYLLVCFSTGKKVIDGTEGELFRLPIIVASSVSGTVQGNLQDIIFSDTGAQTYNAEDVSFDMTVEQPPIVENVTVDATTETVDGVSHIVVGLTNEVTTLTGYQMTLYLPEGVSLATDSEGDYEYTLSSRHKKDHTMTIRSLSDGGYLLVCFSTGKKVIDGTEGELFRLPVNVTSAVSETLQGSLKDMLFSDTNTKLYSAADVTFDLPIFVKEEQTLSLQTLPTMTYGDEPYALPQTTDQGQGLTWTVADAAVATVSNGNLLIANTGTTTVTATQEGSNAFEPFSKSYTLTIEKAPLTIAAGEYTKKQGEAMPEFTLSYEGFKNDETTDVLTKQPVVSCSATVESAPGEYPVTVTGAEAQNYLISYTYGKLIVTAADPVVIKAVSCTRQYGDENPVFEYETEGAPLEGEPELSCEATATSPVGTYDIVVSQGSVKNYNVSYVVGTLTIEKAPLTIAAGEYTKKQGEAMPEFTLSYEGFKNDETTDVLTKQPVVSCSATVESAPGEYPVTVTGAEAQNYLISYTYGKLIVTAADPVVIKAVSCTRQYGDENPVFEYETEGAPLEGEPELSCEATATSPVGTYDIVVSQGSVKNYNVSYVVGTLTIEKAPLTIAAGEYTKKQGEAMPEFTLSYEGFKNDETTDVLTKQPVVSCSATVESAPGEYPVTVTGAEAQNYLISYTYGKLIVTAADPVVIKAVSCTRQYGDENPVFEYETEGAPLEGEPELSCEATATSPVGTYDIVVSQGSVKNYNVSYVVGTLTIEKAPLTIAAGEYTKKQGEAMPEFTLSYEGFKNDETTDVLTKQPVVSCSATVESAPGEYPVTVTGAEAQNYLISYTYGKLIVTAADPVVIKAVSCTRQYGDENPVFEYETEGAPLEGEPELSCEATATSPVGTYDIVVSQGSVKNYNVSYVVGTLTIEKAPLTASVYNYSRDRGRENPEFEIYYSGFKNGEDESVLITPPTATTTATKDSPAGEYPIVVSGGEAKNYDFVYVNGVLTVTVATYLNGVVESGQSFDVYTTTGIRVRTNTTTLRGLPRGMYVINGRKIAW